MSVAMVSMKGQITLPARMRRRLGIKPHDRVVIEESEEAILIRRARDFFELEGFLGKGLPPEQERKAMMKGVADHVLGRRR